MNKLIIPILLLAFISLASMPSNADFINAVNDIRSDYGVCNLVYNSELTAFAYQRAYEIKANGIITHNGWLNNRPENLNKYYLSELLVQSDYLKSAKTYVNALMQSWPHKRLLLDSRQRCMGVAVISDNNQYIVVIILGVAR
jgi:uncharacterized protein YkwD